MTTLPILPWSQDTFSYWSDCWLAQTPEKKLLVAIIQRAILDYIVDPSRYKRKSARQELERKRMAAFEYLYSPDITPWGFRWICEQLRDDGEALRLKILTGVDLLSQRPYQRFEMNITHYRRLFQDGYESGRSRRRKRNRCK